MYLGEKTWDYENKGSVWWVLSQGRRSHSELEMSRSLLFQLGLSRVTESTIYMLNTYNTYYEYMHSESSFKALAHAMWRLESLNFLGEVGRLATQTAVMLKAWGRISSVNLNFYSLDLHWLDEAYRLSWLKSQLTLDVIHIYKLPPRQHWD